MTPSPSSMGGREHLYALSAQQNLAFFVPTRIGTRNKSSFFESYCSLGFEQAAAASRQAAALGSFRQAMDQLKVKRKV
jgi:hypothetical protein